MWCLKLLQSAGFWSVSDKPGPCCRGSPDPSLSCSERPGSVSFTLTVLVMSQPASTWCGDCKLNTAFYAMCLWVTAVCLCRVQASGGQQPASGSRRPVHAGSELRRGQGRHRGASLGAHRAGRGHRHTRRYVSINSVPEEKSRADCPLSPPLKHSRWAADDCMANDTSEQKNVLL